MAQAVSESQLCSFDSHPGKHLLDSDVLFQTALRKEPALEEYHACHRDLIYFCGAVQVLRLDFLPVTWQTHGGLVGQGGTSKIRQSQLTSDISLAFKAIDVGGATSTRNVKDSENIYSLLMAEIQYMEMQPILDSPYIHRVEGICWSVNTTTGCLDPVLVYERTRHGDLYRFMTSGSGRSMDVPERIGVCRDIATGLKTLHDCSMCTFGL